MDGDVGPFHEIIYTAPGTDGRLCYLRHARGQALAQRTMIVIGDAGHATAPSAGQGASMALEDAVTSCPVSARLP